MDNHGLGRGPQTAVRRRAVYCFPGSATDAAPGVAPGAAGAAGDPPSTHPGTCRIVMSQASMISAR